MLRKVGFCIFIISLGYGLFANDLLQQAKEAQKNGDNKKAVELFYKSAKVDNSAEAIYELGRFFYEGKIVKQNFDKAKTFFEQSAGLGFIEAKYALGIFYFNKKNPHHSHKKAYNIFLELAQKENHAPSQNRVGMYLAFGIGIDKDYKEAVKWFEKSANNGYVTGQCHLALMYASGKGVFPNLGRARVIAQKGYDEKNPICIQVWDTFKLENYEEDKGFKLFNK